MRFLSQEANQCLGNTIPPKSNFGLFFNKWLDYRNDRGKYVPGVKDDRSPLVNQARQCTGAASKILQNHHVRQAEYCREMKKAGWKILVFTASLDSPFVSGLGAAHPTETGMVLDHTSGMPYIPASSQKGVLRIAHIINSLCDENGKEKPLEQLLNEGAVSRRDGDNALYWEDDDTSRTMFGYSEGTESLAGQIVVLDAYPLNAPELGEEILNPHFPDYYKQSRGPTEDQSPIPIKFLVVKPGVKFVFRVLLSLPYEKAPLQDIEKLADMAEKNIRKAISEVGMGAKTALGFGRFTVIQQGEPDEIERWVQTDKDRRRTNKQKIREAIEYKKYPWKKWIDQIHAAGGDWGRLKPVLENVELEPFLIRIDVAEAIKTEATLIRKKRPAKWKVERNELVIKCLKPAGLVWEEQQLNTGKSSQHVTQKETDQALLDLISSLTSFKDYSANKKTINIKKLDKECALELEKKFRKFKCNKAKKGAEQTAWRNLNKRIKNLG